MKIPELSMQHFLAANCPSCDRGALLASPQESADPRIPAAPIDSGNARIAGFRPKNGAYLHDLCGVALARGH